jgi:ketosteroid isomerase-like protein
MVCRVGASPDQVLDALFDAITSGDIEAVSEVFAEDVAVWHNVTDRAVDRDASLAILRHFVKTVDDRRYETLERHHWPGGAMQRHIVHGRVGGQPFRAPVCISFELRDGRITRIHEYVDSAAVGILMSRRPSAA